MEFKPLTCGDQPKIRFLVVDDSVFARKNICKMVEAFGEKSPAKPVTASRPSPSITKPARTLF